MLCAIKPMINVDWKMYTQNSMCICINEKMEGIKQLQYKKLKSARKWFLTKKISIQIYLEYRYN